MSDGGSKGWVGAAIVGGIVVGLMVGFGLFLAYGLLDSYWHQGKYEYFGYTWSNFVMLEGWSAALVTAGMLVSGGAKASKAAAAESRSRQAAADDERETTRRRAEGEAAAAVRAFGTLPTSLGRAVDARGEAVRHFSAGAFSPFWAAIEEGFVALGEYNAAIGRIQALASSYAQSVRSYRSQGGTARLPAFPVGIDAAKAATVAAPVALALRDLAYEAQRKPTYAQIWEQRRTTAAIVEGFGSLERAVGALHGALLQSTEALAREVRSLRGDVRGAADTIAGQVAAGSGQVDATMKQAVWYLDDQYKRVLGWR